MQEKINDNNNEINLLQQPEEEGKEDLSKFKY